ncbi:unnamed protein product [Mytilus coruscus]|uniref:Reverse transcriptase domain-containing protein n=1 Tax=Mytilus coruscus TaxID=42192 RepID=A0A6J8A692_MYTCO|nr:unnamed protein product [Mytilus coruscus]
MQRHTKKAKPKKVWMSNNCLLLRKEVRSLGNRLAKAPNNNALRLTYCSCKREYNKLKNKLKKDFFQSLIKQINDINPKNTKEFWGKYLDTNSTSAVNLHDQKVNHLLYADDLLLISESSAGVQNSLDSLQKYSAEWKLDVNFKKTKIIIFSKSKVNKENFYFYYSSNAIEIVDCYKYLGVDFHSSGKFIQAAVSNLSDKAKKVLASRTKCYRNYWSTSLLLRTLFDDIKDGTFIFEGISIQI